MKKEGGWGSYNGHRYYKNPSTGFPYTGWISFGSTYYYADRHGWLVTGWQTIGGYRYYFYPSTYVMARNATIDGVYIGSDGKVSTVYTYAINVLNQVGWNLRAAYNWSASLPYYRMDSSPSQGSEWFALYGFENHTGNCYVMAATFYYMAKVLACSDFPVVFEAHKPDIKVAKKFMKQYSLRPETTCFVGDRPLTDVMCGKNLGCMTILVDSITADIEKPIVRFARKLERCFVRV